MQLNSGIYIISYNNKNYVGSSSNLKKRIREHFSCLKRNTHPNSRLQRAFNKYGIEAFSYKIVSTCDIVKIIRESNDSVVNLASLYGVSKMTIYKIKNNKIWKEV